MEEYSLRIGFFARYREALATAGGAIDVPAAIDNLSSLLQYLERAYPHWREVLTDTDKLIAVNQVLVDDDHPIKPGDEVAFMPPVTGG